jgi:hypothetical protein
VIVRVHSRQRPLCIGGKRVFFGQICLEMLRWERRLGRVERLSFCADCADSGARSERGPRGSDGTLGVFAKDVVH